MAQCGNADHVRRLRTHAQARRHRARGSGLSSLASRPVRRRASGVQVKAQRVAFMVSTLLGSMSKRQKSISPTPLPPLPPASRVEH